MILAAICRHQSRRAGSNGAKGARPADAPSSMPPSDYNLRVLAASRRRRWTSNSTSASNLAKERLVERRTAHQTGRRRARARPAPGLRDQKTGPAGACWEHGTRPSAVADDHGTTAARTIGATCWAIRNTYQGLEGTFHTRQSTRLDKGVSAAALQRGLAALSRQPSGVAETRPCACGARLLILRRRPLCDRGASPRLRAERPLRSSVAECARPRAKSPSSHHVPACALTPIGWTDPTPPRHPRGRRRPWQNARPMRSWP